MGRATDVNKYINAVGLMKEVGIGMQLEYSPNIMLYEAIFY